MIISDIIFLNGKWDTNNFFLLFLSSVSIVFWGPSFFVQSMLLIKGTNSSLLKKNIRFAQLFYQGSWFESFHFLFSSGLHTGSCVSSLLCIGADEETGFACPQKLGNIQVAASRCQSGIYFVITDTLKRRTHLWWKT